MDKMFAGLFGRFSVEVAYRSTKPPEQTRTFSSS